MPEVNTSDPAGKAGGTPSRMGSAGRGGEQHSLSGNGPPILTPEAPANGQTLTEGQGLGRGWAVHLQPTVGAGSLHARDGRLPRGLSQALAAPVQLSQQMATSVPLWPPALGGCGTAWPKGAGHPGCAAPRGGRQGREQHPAGYGTAIPISWVWVDPPALTQLPRLQMARGERRSEDTCEVVLAHAHTWEAPSAQVSSQQCTAKSVGCETQHLSFPRALVQRKKGRHFQR